MEPISSPVLLDDHRQLARAIEGRWDDSAGPAPEPVPEVTPPAATQPDHAAQIAALQAELAAIRQTQALPSPQDIAAASAQGTAAFFEQARQRRQAEQAQQQALQPPQMPTDEDLLTNPQALRYAIGASADYAARSVYQALAPQLQQAQQTQELLQPVLQQALMSAESAARERAGREGIDGATFDQLLPGVRYMIDNAPGTPVSRFQLRTNPEAIAMAALMESRRQNGGVAITPPAPPVSMGSSQGMPTQAGGAHRGPSLPGADLAEKLFGKKFTQGERAWIAQNTAREVTAGAQLPAEIMNR